MTKWFHLENKADSVPSVYLYNEIGGHGINAQDLINELNGIESDKLNVHINSQGGEVFQGLAIYQALKEHPAEVTVTVDALAASIASVIAMAGDKVRMAKTAELMIHDGYTVMQGNASDLTKMVGLLDRASNNIASVYADRAGGDIENWRTAMRTETWFNADEAVAAGLADEVVASKSRMGGVSFNSADLQMFNYAGRAYAPAPVIAAADEPYGAVTYADPGYQEDGKKRYPLDTEAHCRAAWSYINQADNAKMYTSEQLDNIKSRIKKAAEKFGIEISNTLPFDPSSFRAALKGAFNNG